MRIKNLEIENFRSIKHVKIENIPNFVVIVGSNGVGKTSILEAIRFVKSIIAPYHTDEFKWKRQGKDLKNLIRHGQNHAKIILEIEPTSEREKAILGDIEKGEIEFEFQNGSFSESVSPPNLKQLFLQPKDGDENQSVMEFIEAYRIFQEGPAQLEVGQRNEEEFLRSRTGPYARNKFDRLKQKILSIYADDMLIENEEKRFPEIYELIKKLLGREIRVKFSKGALGEIFVENEDGLLELDALSSGEREILMTYFTLHNLKMTNSIILFDEPDLHLHATSQKASIEYLKKMSDQDNQIFVTTHASEIISATSEDSIYHLKRDDINQLVNIKEEKDKLQIFEELGASKFNFLTFDKTIFVEGPSDKKILSQINTDGLSLKFEVFNGGTNMSANVLEMISKLGRVAMIKDRDFYSEDEINKMKAKAPKKLYFWSRREIENFFLDSPILYDIYKTLGKNEINDFSQFKYSVKKISNTYKQQTISDRFLFEQNTKLSPAQPKLAIGSKAKDEIRKYYETKKERTIKIIDQLDTKISELETEVDNIWEEEWINNVDPKIILSYIGKDYFEKEISLDSLMNMIILKLDSNEKFPKELVDTITDIAEK